MTRKLRFTEGQAVTVTIGFEKPETRRATIIRNIDATCAALTDMWLIQPEGWRQFGISGKALQAA